MLPQIVNDLEKAREGLAAVRKRRADVAAAVERAKDGKEDSVREYSRARVSVRVACCAVWQMF